MDNMREQLELAKYRYEQKQLNDLEGKEHEMLNKIDELDDVATDDHKWQFQIRDQVVKMRLKNQELEKREKQFDEYIHRMERETEVEKLVRKKLEIQRMQRQVSCLPLVWGGICPRNGKVF